MAALELKATGRARLEDEADELRKLLSAQQIAKAAEHFNDFQLIFSLCSIDFHCT